MLNGFGEPAAIAAIQRDLSTKYGVKVAYSPADLLKRDEITTLVEQVCGLCRIALARRSSLCVAAANPAALPRVLI